MDFKRLFLLFTNNEQNISSAELVLYFLPLITYSKQRGKKEKGKREVERKRDAEEEKERQKGRGRGGGRLLCKILLRTGMPVSHKLCGKFL